MNTQSPSVACRITWVLVSLILVLSSLNAWAEFPQRGAAQLIEGGIQLFQLSLSGDAPGQTMKLWVYLPAGNHGAKSLGCVFVAPAGSNLMTGMVLNEGDRVEHLPYVKAGFAVIGYELDGAMEGRNTAALFTAVPKFMAAHGGIDNAKTAVDYAIARVPEIDPERLYAAGHSSAATVALDVAAADARIKACCAYAPVADLRKRFKPALVPAVNRKAPGFDAFVDTASPAQHVDALKGKPVFLLSAEDDTNVPAQSVKDFAAAIQQAGGTQVKMVTTARGGHYESMVAEGMPKGIEFLKEIEGKKK
jgi:dipeptidyl aminopeptidase/acylaminoacyl peptidase